MVFSTHRETNQHAADELIEAYIKYIPINEMKYSIQSKFPNFLHTYYWQLLHRNCEYLL